MDDEFGPVTLDEPPDELTRKEKAVSKLKSARQWWNEYRKDLAPSCEAFERIVDAIRAEALQAAHDVCRREYEEDRMGRERLEVQLRRENAELRRQRDALRDAAKAYQDLSACYRIGKRPTEKLFAALEVGKRAIEESSE